MKKHQECKDTNIIKKRKILYRKFVEKFKKPMLTITSDIWTRAQLKGLDNGLKDFNWLILHKRLPVRSTLYDRELQISPAVHLIITVINQKWATVTHWQCKDRDLSILKYIRNQGNTWAVTVVHLIQWLQFHADSRYWGLWPILTQILISANFCRPSYLSQYNLRGCWYYNDMNCVACVRKNARVILHSISKQPREGVSKHPSPALPFPVSPNNGQDACHESVFVSLREFVYS